MEEDFSRPMRLQKYLAAAGLCSRREAEEWISDGKVKVNGKIATIGQSVTPGDDQVMVGRTIVPAPTQERVVLAMNKPRGYLCTNEDQFGGQTVFELIPPEFAKRRLFCVGRLDKDSDGLLLITDDGELANRIMHPSSGIVKRYRVRLNRPLDTTLIPKLLKGAKVPVEAVVEGGKPGEEFLQFTKVTVNPEDAAEVDVHLSQGRKREIRRLFQLFGFFVKELHRYQIGGFVMRKMPRGDCRKLTKKELEMLFK